MVFQISAQESRRKKKEYLDKLEVRCQRVEGERERWRRRCEELEATNLRLQRQLHLLQETLVIGGKASIGDIEVD